jgi:ABC-type nickel/cobalt efflux system permease component RcnA
LRKPSTKRSDVVNPTSNKPPTINQSHGIGGMKILSLDERDSRDTLHRNRQAAQEALKSSLGGGDMLDHIPHPHLHKRRQMMEQHEARRSPTDFNNWLAVKITNVVGTMWCAYAFAILALVSLPQAIQSGTSALIGWIAQTFLQLVLLSIIMVGQKVAAETSDQQLKQTYLDAEALLQISDDMHKLLKQNTMLTEQINKLICSEDKR